MLCRRALCSELKAKAAIVDRHFWAASDGSIPDFGNGGRSLRASRKLGLRSLLRGHLFASPSRLLQHFYGHDQRLHDQPRCFSLRHDLNLQFDRTEFAAYPWQSASNSSRNRTTIFAGAPASNTEAACRAPFIRRVPSENSSRSFKKGGSSLSC